MGDESLKKYFFSYLRVFAKGKDLQLTLFYIFIFIIYIISKICHVQGNAEILDCFELIQIF